MSDAVLFGLCLWCVGATWVATQMYIKTLRLKELLIWSAEIIKEIGEGNATVEVSNNGKSVAIKRNK
jgi:hypothetical protein